MNAEETPQALPEGWSVPSADPLKEAVRREWGRVIGGVNTGTLAREAKERHTGSGGSHLTLPRQGVESWDPRVDSGKGRSVGLRMPLVER